MDIVNQERQHMVTDQGTELCKVYTSPTLTEYGNIANLTQAGEPGGTDDGFISNSKT